MEFDNRSLVVAAALASILCTVARFLLRAMHPAMPGLAHWAWASLMGTAALILVAAQRTAPSTILQTAGLAMMLGALVLTWDGFRRFLDRPPLVGWHLTIAALISVLPMVLALLGLTVAQSAFVGSLLIAGLSALMARELLWRAPSGPMAMRATGGVYALTSLFFLLRAGSLAHQGLIYQPLSDAGTSAALLWALFFMLAVTLGMVLMAGERLQAELDDQVSRDPLTGALNRRAFALLADKAVARARRQSEALSLLVMDLDHFKSLNDQLGHAAGDLYLSRFVALAEETLRAEDMLCRHGGEEFLALMPATSLDQALAAAERLRGAFAARTAEDTDLPVPATVSIGVGALAAGETLGELIRRVDLALYSAKHLGRDRCEEAMPPQGVRHTSGTPA